MIALSVWLIGTHNRAIAQTFRGSINGTLLDPSGAILAEIPLQAANDATGVSNHAVTTSAGQFTFADLPQGAYTVSVEAPGFQPYSIKGVTVEAGSIHSLTIHLSVANKNTVVEVSANALTLETETITRTSLIPSVAIHEIGQHGGDFLATLALVPGFAGNPNQGQGSINGARSTQTNFQLDGTDNNDPWQNMAGTNEGGIAPISGALLPLDAVEEFSYQANGGAEYGRNSAGTYNATLKSGGNQVHGSAYYQFRNEATAAKSPFVSEKYENRSSNWGGSIGGPIIHNKTFYFLALEKQDFDFNPGVYSTEPGAGYQALARSLLSQYAVTENPVSTKLLNTLWPADALSITKASVNNRFTLDNETGYSWNGVIKLDHAFNDNNKLSVHWYAGEGNQIGPSGSYLKSYYQVAPEHVQNYSAIYNRTLSASSTNQLQLGVSSFLQHFNDFNHSQDVSSLGLVTGSQFTGAPNITIGSFDAIGVTAPTGRNTTTGHLTDVLSVTQGRHELRFGGEYRRVQVDAFYFNGSRGAIKFNGSVGPWSSATKLADGTTIDSYTRSLADFLAGYSSSSNITYGDQERMIYQHLFSLFASDSWHLTRRFTLNLGVRYEYEGSIGNDDKNLSVFLPNKGVTFLGDGIDALYPASKLNFAPRVGAAYTPSEKLGLVIRTGGGIYYDTPNLGAFLSAKASNGAATGVNQNPGGADSVFAVSQQANTIVSGKSFFQNASKASTVGLFTVDQNFQAPRSYNFYLQLQKSLGGNVVAELGYVGTLGRHLLGWVDINAAALNSLTGKVVQSSRPYYSQYPNYAAINQLTSGFSSNYNAVQATLRTKSWYGFSSQASYTWSHNLDTLSSIGQVINPLDIRRNYSNSDNDIRHTLVGFLSYVVPGLEHSPAVVRAITRGWTVSSGFNFHTGKPFTIKNSNNDSSGTGDLTQLVDVVGNPFAGVSHAINNRVVTWINPNAFAAPAKGTFGNERRNQFYGPGYATADLNISRSFRLTERIKAVVRAELYNVFNRTNLASPSTTYNSGGTFGLISGTINSGGATGTAAGEPFSAQFRFQVTF